MKIIKNKMVAVFLIVCLSFTLTFAGLGFAFAANTESQLRNELNNVEAQQDELGKKMSQVEKDVKETQATLNNLNYQISKASSDISAINEKIKAKEEAMVSRENNLSQRLVVMYKNGSVGFIDVLLGSNSISEFVSNLGMIQKIYQNDVEVLENLQRDHEELEKTKADLKEKQQALAEKKVQAAEEKQELDKKKKALEKEEDALKAEADKLTSEILSLMEKNSQYVGGQFVWPCPASSYITSSFGNRLHPVLKVWKFHTGIDVGCSSGKNIIAVAAGKVIMSTTYGGYGNCVMVDHGGGIVTLYGHASSLCVSKGDIVSKGQVIAKVGSTGRSTGPHLHFEVRENGDYVNPMKYF